MPVPDPGLSHPLKGRECPKKRALYDIASIYDNGMGLVEVCGVLGGLGCFWVVWGVSMDRKTFMLTVKFANEFGSRYR